jgi:hypothetical protein
MDELEIIELQRDEWEAWRLICTELERINIDINKAVQLHAALVYWGEAMGNLRRNQDPRECETWRVAALDELAAIMKL